MIFSHAAEFGKHWAIRPYRDRDANCGPSARLLTLSKVTLPSAELTSSNNLPSQNPIETEIEPQHNKNYNYSRSSSPGEGVVTGSRPVTRSLTRLAAPREILTPCPKTFRTKNRAHWSSTTVTSATETNNKDKASTKPPSSKAAQSFGKLQQPRSSGTSTALYLKKEKVSGASTSQKTKLNSTKSGAEKDGAVNKNHSNVNHNEIATSSKSMAAKNDNNRTHISASTTGVLQNVAKSSTTIVK